MIEVCFCGWRGPVQNRRYVRTDDYSEALACPNCGHLDPVDYLPELSRRELLDIAMQRTTSRRYSNAPIRLRTAHPAA
jgi:hypothetical protein